MKKTKEQRKDEALKAYHEIMSTAYKIYEAILAPAWKTYQAINMPMWDIYQAKCKEIDEEIVKEEEDIKIIDGKRYKLIKKKK